MEFFDLGIIIGYLVLTLVAGLYQSRKVKSMKDYAIADRNYSTPVMVATISATLIGGGSTVGLVEKVSLFGLSYLILFLGDPISKLMIANFLAGRMERFKGLISVGDIMEKCYGKESKIITGLAGSLLSAGLLAAQISALGFLFQYFFNLSHLWGAFIGFGIVVLYSTFGGIRAVTLTDVIQFSILLIAIPMVCDIGLGMVGGYEALFHNVPEKLLTIVPEEGKLLHSFSLFIVIIISCLTPPAVQRLLMSRDKVQIKKSFTISAFLDVPFYSTIGLIGLIAVALKLNGIPSLTMPYLINSILPVGFKGLAMVGMLAVIMSTCDSYLNTASVSVVHDTIRPLIPNLSARSELLMMKLTTFILGFLAIFIAVKYKTIMDIFVGAFNVWGPVVIIPLCVGIFGCHTYQRSFFWSAGSGFIMSLVWIIMDFEAEFNIDPLIPGMVANGIVFFITHQLYKRRRRVLIPSY